jgi:tetratricopeptide (TPR) repeat protein
MNSRQKLVILITAVLAVLIYFAPRTASEKKQEEKTASDFTLELKEAKKNLTPEQKIIFDKVELGLNHARETDTEQAWMAAASDFLKGARFVPNEKKPVLYQGAIRAFEKVLAVNPNNLSAKTNLGTSIVESSSFLGTQPMKGITLLREVIQKDSNNIEANLQLGLFSVTSRQFEKAVERFHRILRIDSARIDMYIYLGDTYLAMGEKSKAITSYEKYKVSVTDTLIVKNINDYIKKLKQQP